ncbi:MAG: electron transfer flavoprotein subunit alpha/FixB family protein [Candidatus Lokiarchaeota archaeon]|nr:electron transfer flavoprotein subunit alpha/FixB family protein [Candidatus Lokiarchaeota archaeon]
MKANECKGIFVFTEIQDHEKILDGALELLSKGRELASKLNEKLYAVVFGLNVEQYLPKIESFGPDVIIHNKETKDPQTLKHYNCEIFPDMWEELIKKYLPSIVLFPATEAGTDLSARLAQRFATGLTAHCSDLEIDDLEDYGTNLLIMKRPAFSGNLSASIICPDKRPQMATIQQGVFKQQPVENPQKPEYIAIECKHQLEKLRIVNVESPTRYQRECVPLERSNLIVAGGRGMGSKGNFEKLFNLANLIDAEVGATRVPVFNEWCDQERMIGQTGKVVKPDLYINFGISGQIQHTTSIRESKRIISINTDPKAKINDISDYIINEDAVSFIEALIKRIQQEKKQFCEK